MSRSWRTIPTIDAVYSIGGGNNATLRAFEERGRGCRRRSSPTTSTATTSPCCAQRRISAVLHHDLRADLRRACRAVMQAHGALPGAPSSRPSHVQVITPYNEPATLAESGDMQAP